MEPFIVIVGFVTLVTLLVISFRVYDHFKYRKQEPRQYLRIDKLQAPKGGTATVSVKNGKLSVKTSGPGAVVEGVYSNGDQVLNLGVPDPVLVPLALALLTDDSTPAPEASDFRLSYDSAPPQSEFRVEPASAPEPSPAFESPTFDAPAPVFESPTFESPTFDSSSSSYDSSSFDSGGGFDGGSSGID